MPGTVLDYVSAPEFSDKKLTEMINIPPYVTGLPAQLGLFVDEPINTTYVRIGVVEDDITIIPARSRGGPNNKNMRGDRAQLLIDVPHFPLDDAITPSDIQNIGGWGENFIMESLAGVYSQKLAGMRLKHDATSHHMDWGALKGLIVDAEAKTLLNLFTIFGVTQTTVDFVLGTTTTDLAAKVRAVKSAIRLALRGAPMSGIRVFASKTWYDSFVGHTFIKDFMKYYAQPGQVNPNRDSVDDVFVFGGVTFQAVEEEFQVRNTDGTFTTYDAVADGEAIAVPLGTGLFKRYAAPPDTIFNANNAPTPGDRVFVSTNDLPHGKGRDVHTESNLIPVCTRPGVMIKLTTS